MSQYARESFPVLDPLIFLCRLGMARKRRRDDDGMVGVAQGIWEPHNELGKFGPSQVAKVSEGSWDLGV